MGNPADEVSSDILAMIGAPYPPHFNADPKTLADWKELIDRRAKLAIANIPAMKPWRKEIVKTQDPR
jgi:monoterpene epsilon-lactone hydrolase